MIAFSQSKLGWKQADHQLHAAGQDMLVRLTQAWFDAMQARDNIQATDAQVQTAQQQLESSQRANAKGILSRTDLEDARAKHEQALAEQAMAQSELEIKLGDLQIIGPLELSPPITICCVGRVSHFPAPGSQGSISGLAVLIST